MLIFLFCWSIPVGCVVLLTSCDSYTHMHIRRGLQFFGMYWQNPTISLSLWILLNFSMSVEFKIDVNALQQHAASDVQHTYTPSRSNLNRCRRWRQRCSQCSLSHTHDTRSSIQSARCHCIHTQYIERNANFSLSAWPATSTTAMPLFVSPTQTYNIQRTWISTIIHNNLLFSERRSTKSNRCHATTITSTHHHLYQPLPGGKSHFDANEIPPSIELCTAISYSRRPSRKSA